MTYGIAGWILPCAVKSAFQQYRLGLKILLRVQPENGTKPNKKGSLLLAQCLTTSLIK